VINNIYFVTALRTVAPITLAAGTATPRVAATNVWMATFTTVSSGMNAMAPAAAATDTRAPVCKSPGLIPIPAAKSGRAPGANSTTFGRTGRSSGPDASTRTRISGFDAARSRKGSSLVRETPASCALDRRPLSATFVRRPEDSMSDRRFLTAILFPVLSTSGVMMDDPNFVTKGRAVDGEVKAFADAANRAFYHYCQIRCR